MMSWYGPFWQVKLIDNFTNKKGMTSHCYRIAYRSMERSLTDEEINDLQVFQRMKWQHFRVPLFKLLYHIIGYWNLWYVWNSGAVESAGASGEQVESCSSMSILAYKLLLCKFWSIF